MDKQNVLKERMAECGITYDSILKEIDPKIHGPYTVVVYISKFDGLGNKNSDFDVYVLMDEDVSIRSSVVRIECACCDIEYWSASKLISLLNEIPSNPNRKIFKIIKRIKSGIVIFSSGTSFSQIDKIISAIDIDNYIYKYYRVFTNAEYDDAVKMFKNQEYISSLMCCQRAINNLIAAINARNGHANLNLKWAPHIFIKNHGFGNRNAYENFMKLAVYSCVDENNIARKVEQLLDFLTTEISRITLF